MAISLNEYTSRQQGGGASTFRPMSIGEYADPMQSLDAAPSRALLGDIWSGIQSGAVGSAEMALKGLSTLGWDEADTLLQDIADFRASSTFDDRSTQYAEGGFRKLAVDTFESFTQNMGVRLPAMAVGALAGPVGIAAGFLSGGPLYGLAEYHDFMKEAEAAGVPRDVARSKAIISGIAEGGLELAGDAILLAWNAVPGVRLARQAATTELKEAVVAPFMQRFAGRILKTAAEEVPTEMAQAWAETSLRKSAGIEQGQSPWEAAKGVVGVTASTSVLFALSGMGGDANQRLAETRNANAKVIADRVKANGGTITAQDLDDIVTYVAEPGKKLAFDFLRTRKTPGGRETAVANFKAANPLYQEADFDSTPVPLTPDEQRLLDAHGLIAEGKSAMWGVAFNDPVVGHGSMYLPIGFTEADLRSKLVEKYKANWEYFWKDNPEQRAIAQKRLSEWQPKTEPLTEGVTVGATEAPTGREQKPLAQEAPPETPSVTPTVAEAVTPEPPSQSNLHRTMQKRIHQTSTRLGLDEGDYQAILKQATGKTSTADMSDAEIETAYHALREQAGLRRDVESSFTAKLQDAFSLTVGQARATTSLLKASGFDFEATQPVKGGTATGENLPGQTQGTIIKGITEWIKDGKSVVRGLTGPDVSTAIHESSHVWRRTFLNRDTPLADRRGITDADIDVIEAHVGAKDGVWDRTAEEKYARTVERYVRDGKAPTARLARVFAQFKQWMGTIYKDIVNGPLDITINPDVKAVLDKIYSRGPKAIQESQRVQQASRIRAWANAQSKQAVKGLTDEAEIKAAKDKVTADLGDVLEKATGKRALHLMSDEEITTALPKVAQFMSDRNAEALKEIVTEPTKALSPIQKVLSKLLKYLDPAHTAHIKYGRELTTRVLKTNWSADEHKAILLRERLASVDQTVEEFWGWLRTFNDVALDRLEIARSAPAQSPEGTIVQQEAIAYLRDHAPDLLQPKVHEAIQAINDMVYQLANAVTQKVTGHQLAYKESYGRGKFDIDLEITNFIRRMGDTKDDAKVWALSEGFMKRSEFKSYADAVAFGMKHLHKDPIANAMSELRVVASLGAMADMKVALMQSGKGKYIVEETSTDKAPIGWVRVGSKNDPVWKGTTFAEPELARLINNQLEINMVTHNKYLRNVRDVGSLMQWAKFSFSMFHFFSITKQAFTDTGYLGFLNPSKLSATTKAMTTSYDAFKKRIASDPDMKALQDRIISLGGGHVGPGNYYAFEHTAMQKMDDVYRKVGIAKALSNAPKWLQRVGRLPIDFNNWLFSTYIPLIKTVKTMEAAGEFRLKNGREMSDAELMDSIKEIQNLYGTMDERLFGRSGTVTSLMRFMFLAPGYAEGNLRTVMLSAMKWKGNDKATRSRVNILNSFVLTGILATVGTMILKGKAPDPPETPDDVRDLFKIDTGRTDADGKRIMIDLMTFDRDYFDVYGKLLTGKGLDIPADLMKRMSGMKAPYVTLLKDMLAVFSGTAVYDWKDDKVWHLTDPVLVKVMKATVHTLETIEPISVSVFRQAKSRKVDTVVAAVESMLGFRPAKSEQDLRDSRTMRKLYDLRDRREELFRVLDDTDNPRAALDKYNRNVQSIATSGIISSDVKQELGKLMVDGDAYIGYLVQNLERPGTTDKTRAHALKVLEQFGVSRAEYERYTRYRSKALKQRRRANQHAAHNSYMSQYSM